MESLGFLTSANAGLGVMLEDYAPVDVSGHEVNEGNNRKQHDGYDVGQTFLQCSHCNVSKIIFRY